MKQLFSRNFSADFSLVSTNLQKFLRLKIYDCREVNDDIYPYLGGGCASAGGFFVLPGCSGNCGRFGSFK